MPLNVRPCDRENEKKVFAFLRENFFPFSDLDFTHIEDPTAPFDYHLFLDGEHMFSLDVKGCGMDYEKINQFEPYKAEDMKKHPLVSHFIAYNYLDGRVKLYCLDDAELWEKQKTQLEHRTDRYLTKPMIIIVKAPQVWHFKGSDATKYIKSSL
jgi:hypothetical protein